MKNRILYLADYCLTPFRKIFHAGILCEGEKILAVGGASAFEREHGLEIVELEGSYATPGLIDTHIHGAGGFDSTQAGQNGANISLMCKTLSSHGITSFVPTIISSGREKMFNVVSSLVKMIGNNHDGAVPVGIHLEGPYLNREKHGSQSEKDIRPIDIGEARELISEGRKKIKIMTFAPELTDSVRLIELLIENNIIPSMGHCMADEKSALKAVEAGARRCTHIYNGMPPLHHRIVGLTAVALTDDRVLIEVILDEFHLHSRMLDLACRAKPKDKLIGVSDAIEGTGLHDGIYHLGEAELKVQDGKSTTTDGTLAGTTVTLEKGWRHLLNSSHFDITEAAACLTINPAKSLGLEDRGEIRPGKTADLTFFDSSTNSVKLTVCKGRIVYDPQGIYKSGTAN